MTKQGDIAALTGIRGIAALWVVLYHLYEFGETPGPLGALIRHGYIAVDIFFVLSGFVMALSYERLFAQDATLRAHLVFMLRRLARIYPLYIAITCLLAAPSLYHAITGSPWADNMPSFLASATMTESWGITGAIDGPSWSISAEFFAYLIFPALLMLTNTSGRRSAAISFMVAFAALALATRATEPASYVFPRMGPLDISWAHTFWPVVRCVCEFTMGLVAFSAARNSRARRLLTIGRAGDLIAIAILLALLSPRLDLLTALLLPLLMISLLGDGYFAKAMSADILQSLGRLSYAIYLLHGPLLDLYRRLLATLLTGAPGRLIALILFGGALILGAMLCHRFIEIPGRRAIRALEAWLFPRTDAAVSASKQAGVSAYPEGALAQAGAPPLTASAPSP